MEYIGTEIENIYICTISHLNLLFIWKRKKKQRGRVLSEGEERTDSLRGKQMER